MLAHMKHVEIEIQVKVEHMRPLQRFLQENAKFMGEYEQIDTYYTPAHKDFISVRPVNEWLRLRRQEGLFSITYKNWYRDESGRSSHCDEYESTIGNLEAMEKLFAALDMKKLITVHKIRKTYRYKDYEIALDTIKDQGDFVEVEYKGLLKVDSPLRVNDAMISFLKDQGCGKITRNNGGYPFQLLFPENVIEEEF